MRTPQLYAPRFEAARAEARALAAAEVEHRKHLHAARVARWGKALSVVEAYAERAKAAQLQSVAAAEAEERAEALRAQALANTEAADARSEAQARAQAALTECTELSVELAGLAAEEKDLRLTLKHLTRTLTKIAAADKAHEQQLALDAADGGGPRRRGRWSPSKSANNRKILSSSAPGDGAGPVVEFV